MSPPPEWFTGVQQRYNELGAGINALGEDRLEKLEAINLVFPSDDSPALRFYFSVSWMYIAVYEVGTVSFNFLADRSVQMRLDADRKISSFRQDVHALRTMLQHNLNPESRRDAQTRTTAMRWMLQACNREEVLDAEFWPDTTEDWARVCDNWLASSARFLEATNATVGAIAADDSREAIVSEWARRCSRGLRPHEFNSLVSASATALALPPLAVEQVVQRHLGRWNDQLRLLDDGADMFAEARQIVDQTLNDDWQSYCPVDGDDIIKTFSVPAGRAVGKLLTEARVIWLKERCSKEEVLRILSERGAGAAEEHGL
jgi:hypothetical protein